MFSAPIQGTLIGTSLKSCGMYSHKFLISFEKYLKYFNIQKIKYYLSIVCINNLT